VGDFEDKEAHIVKGLQVMKGCRKPDGEWRSFPFFYAVYALLELDLEPAHAELKHALPVMERYIKNNRVGIYSQRRITVIQKALEKLN
jgi:hypothetical protein